MDFTEEKNETNEKKKMKERIKWILHITTYNFFFFFFAFSSNKIIEEFIHFFYFCP